MSLIRYFPIFLFFASTPVFIETQEVPRGEGLSLAPGDILRVLVWREEDLSGDFQVDENGKVILPLLGEVPVDDKKWGEVRDLLLQEYRRELRNPSIELTPFRSVYVLGEVNLPGRYNIHPTNDNLAGALSLAGGISPDGDIRNLRVVRDDVMVLDGIPVEQGLAQLGIKSGDQLFVGRRGWIDRNSTFIVSAVLSVSSIVVALLTAGGG